MKHIKCDTKKCVCLLLYLFLGMLAVHANNVKLTIQLDNKPDETTWEIKNVNNTIVASGGPYNTPNELIVQTITLSAGSYTFTINDSSGDGMCCTYGDGYYYLVNETGDALVAGGEDFDSSKSSDFTIFDGENIDYIFIPNVDSAYYFNGGDFYWLNPQQIGGGFKQSVGVKNNETNLVLNRRTADSWYYETDRFYSPLSTGHFSLGHSTNGYAQVTDPKYSFFGMPIPKFGATFSFWVNRRYVESVLTTNPAIGMYKKTGSNETLEDDVDTKFTYDVGFTVDNNAQVLIRNRYIKTDNKMINYEVPKPLKVGIKKWYLCVVVLEKYVTRIYLGGKDSKKIDCHYLWNGFFSNPFFNDPGPEILNYGIYGAFADNHGDFHQQKIDDVMVWYGHKFSLEQVQALFNCQSQHQSAICLGDIPIVNTLLCEGNVTNTLYTESFETDMGIWTQNTDDDIDWTRHTGSTPSTGTGPTWVPDGSYYMYVESSSPNYPNKEAILESGCIKLGENDEFYINFNMEGSAVGSLHVDIKTDTSDWTELFTFSGQQQVINGGWAWWTSSLSGYANQIVKFRIRAVTGNGWQGDIAIDNIFIGDPSEITSKNTKAKDPVNNSVEISQGPEITNITIHPNPFNETLIIKGIKEEEIMKVEVFDIQGEILYQQKIGTTGNEIEVNLSNISQGIYIMRVTNDKGIALNKYIIKN